VRELVVLIDRAVAGVLTEGADDRRLKFTYEDDYQQRPDPTALSVSMPVALRDHPPAVVEPWLWGLLPDNDAVLARWARHYQVSPSSVFSLLRTPIGLDCAGAVRFVTREGLDDALTTTGDVHWLSTGEVAQRLRELKEDTTAWLGRDFTGQFSLGGAQAKTALYFDGQRWGIPTGALATNTILKPAVSGFDDHDLNEHLCLEAGRRAGLVCVRSRIEQFEDQRAIVIDRYDRQLHNDQAVRIHQEDLCQALSVHPSRKYQGEGGPAPDQIAKLFRRAIEPVQTEDAVWRFAEALAWNWIIGGTDAHAKNYSLLISGGSVRLAPLYDIASALPYGSHEKKLRVAMKVGDDDALYNYRNPWPTAAKRLEVDEGRLIDRVGELAKAAPEAFDAVARQEDPASLGRDMPQQLVDLVADRCRRCLDLLSTGGH